jgi:hypothetical protein
VKICQKEKKSDFLSRCAGKIISYWCISHESSIISMHRKLLFFPILWCSHTSDHPQEELAKFGYSLLERKVENFQNPSIFWRRTGTYCLNRVTLDKSIPQNMAILAPFFSQKFFAWVALDFYFFHQVAKNCPQKKKKPLVQESSSMCNTMEWNQWFLKKINFNKLPKVGNLYWKKLILHFKICFPRDLS